MIYLNDDIEKLPLKEALQQISEQRREQALKFKYELGQRLSVAAYLLLKEGLRQEYGITGNPVFAYTEHGKPSIQGHPEIFFNLSHCRQGAICAIGRGPIGVDIESIREYRESLVAYTMNGEEKAQIERAPNPAVEFIKLWTMKESLLKLTGTGISTDMKDVLTNTQLRYRHTTVVNQQRGYVWSVCEAREVKDDE